MKIREGVRRHSLLACLGTQDLADHNCGVGAQDLVDHNCGDADAFGRKLPSNGHGVR